MSKTAAIVLLTATMAGCATTGGIAGKAEPAHVEWLFSSQSITWLSQQHEQQLEQATPGSIVTLGQTPWGKNTTLTRQPGYFAATGANCFASTLKTGGNQPLAVNVCNYPGKGWGITNALQPAESNLLTTTGGDQ